MKSLKINNKIYLCVCFKHRSKFAIVEFLDESEIEVIPKSWISKQNDKLVCKWPKWKSTSRIQNAVKAQMPPTDDFISYSIKVLYKADDYEKARNKLNEAELTSDLNTEAESDIPAKRQRRSNKKYDDTDSEEETTTQRKMPVQRKRVSPRKHQSSSQLPPLPVFQRSPSSIYKSTMPTTPVRPSTSLFVPESPEAPKLPVSAKDRKVLTILKEIKAQVGINTRLILGMKRRLDASTATNAEREHPQENVKIDLPLKNLQEQKDLDRRLRDDEALHKHLIRTLGGVGGESLEHTTRRVLSTLMENQLAVLINWTGQGGKFMFKDLKLKDIVLKVVGGTKESFNIIDIEKKVKEWFRNAPDRDGGRKRRQQRKAEAIRQAEAEREANNM